MPVGGEDTVDVFEADGTARAAPGSAATDHVVNGPTRAPRTHWLQSRWVALPALDRRAIVVSAVAVAVALFAGVNALHAHPAIHRTVRTTVIPAPAVSVDAFGCPRGRQCVTRVGPPAVLAAAREALPVGRVTYAVQEVDAHTGAVYRTVLRLTARETSVQVDAQCVPGAAAVTGTPLRASRVSGTTLTPVSIDAPTPAGLKYWTITLPGPQASRVSCGVEVRAESALDQGIDGLGIDTVVNLLADDPRLRASP